MDCSAATTTLYWCGRTAGTTMIPGSPSLLLVLLKTSTSTDDDHDDHDDLKQIFLLQNISLFSCSFFIPSPTKYVIDIFSCCCWCPSFLSLLLTLVVCLVVQWSAVSSYYFCCCCPSLFVAVVGPCRLVGGTMVCSPLLLLLLSLSVGWWYDGLLLFLFRLDFIKTNTIFQFF